MQATVNVNGVVTDGDRAVVSALDHGFLYGDGVYETLRTYHRRPFLLDRHLARLRASADRLALAIPPTDSDLETRIHDTIRRVNLAGEVTIRMVITRGVGDLTYDPSACPDPTIVLIARPHHDVPITIQRDGVTVVVTSVRGIIRAAWTPASSRTTC